MATDSKSKLTRYTTAVTVLTADCMNSFFGGEHGYRDDLSEDDPLVSGHVHDGIHADGHSSKVLLTDGAHVKGSLPHENLGGFDGTDPAVQRDNIQCYSEDIYGTPAQRRDSGEAPVSIPEYVIDQESGSRCYYLDLSMSAGGSDTNVQYNDSGGFSGDDGFVYADGSVGVGTDSPQSRLHVSDTSGANPIIVEGIQSGTGTTLVITGSGALVSDSSIGPDQNLFKFVEIGAAGSGATSGDSTMGADNTEDTLYIIAGNGISLDGSTTGLGGPDTITIESTATGSSPAGSDTSLQFNNSGAFGLGENIRNMVQQGGFLGLHLPIVVARFPSNFRGCLSGHH